MADDQQHYPRASAPVPGPPKHRRGMGPLSNPAVLAALAATVIGVVFGAAVGIFGGDDGTNTSTTQSPGGQSIAPGETPSGEPPSPTGTVTVPGSPGASTGSGEPIVVPVYYVGRDIAPGGRHYLYREFRRVQPAGGDDPAITALQAMFELPALDADYQTLWPAGASVTELRRSGDTATVVLSDEVANHRTDADTAGLAAQQLVHTLTAADRSVHAVRLVIGGQETASLFGHQVGTLPLRRAPEVDVVAPVWIIDPYDGAVLGQTFTLSGTANVFEATVSYVVRGGGSTVREGSLQATSGTGTRGEWSVELTLPAGDYVIEAFEASAENGEPLFIDSKRVTVR